MLIKQECAHCKRHVPVTGSGRLYEHYTEKGAWAQGWCKGSGKTALETRKEISGAENTDQ